MAASLFGLVCFDVRHQRHAVILVVAVYGYAAAWCLTHAYELAHEDDMEEMVLIPVHVALLCAPD